MIVAREINGWKNYIKLLKIYEVKSLMMIRIFGSIPPVLSLTPLPFFGYLFTYLFSFSFHFKSRFWVSDKSRQRKDKRAMNLSILQNVVSVYIWDATNNQSSQFNARYLAICLHIQNERIAHYTVFILLHAKCVCIECVWPLNFLLVCFCNSVGTNTTSISFVIKNSLALL